MHKTEKFLANLRLQVSNSISFFGRSNSVIVMVHTNTGYIQIDSISLTEYAQFIAYHLKASSDDRTSFDPTKKYNCVKLDSDEVINVSGRKLILTHSPNRQGFISAISKIKSEQEIKDEFYEKDAVDKSNQEKEELCSINESDHAEELQELTNDALIAHRNYRITTGEFESKLSTHDYVEPEIRMDPTSDLLGFGMFAGYVLPDTINEIVIEY
jgi:hypothetical protein